MRKLYFGLIGALAGVGIGYTFGSYYGNKTGGQTALHEASIDLRMEVHDLGMRRRMNIERTLQQDREQGEFMAGVEHARKVIENLPYRR